ncbi:MAG TPA: GGDEF domain-containing protein [Candidatus Sulfotelmatobacter sp.]|nr:GGDEF domain-containing protein [Candidatus Sulfotelmatobacter sp.]
MPISRKSVIWVGAATLLAAVLALGCALFRPGMVRIALSDLITAALMLSVVCAFGANAISASGRTRLFWILQAFGWALLVADQVVWIDYDLIMRAPMPPMHIADVLLFLAGVPMLASLLLRPHMQPSQRTARLGTLDFLMLLLWWVYLYIFFIICWQYVLYNPITYHRNYDWLFGAETLVLAGVSGMLLRQSSGKWRIFYASFFGAITFNAIAFYLLNGAIELNTYFTGSWYDIPYAVSFVVFTGSGLLGRGLHPTAESRKDEAYTSAMAIVAMLAVLSLPVLAIHSFSSASLPPEVVHFRVLITFCMMFAMAFLVFVKLRRLNQELQTSNVILEEASLTDPLTGLRNRRYFSLTIESDVSHTLRAYADSHDSRLRDLIFYLIDADNFKEVNDRFGHAAGDGVLMEMARRISSSIRNSDVLVRWGGEEFLIISRYTDRREAETLASRVLTAVGSTPFTLRTPDETIFRTCSVGWAAFPWLPSDPSAVNYEEVLSLADRALNQAKQAGKNRAIGVIPTAAQPARQQQREVGTLATIGPAVARSTS